MSADEIIETYVKMSNVSVQAAEALDQATGSYQRISEEWSALTAEIKDFQSALRAAVEHFVYVRQTMMEADAVRWSEQMDALTEVCINTSSIHKHIIDHSQSALAAMKGFEQRQSQAMEAHDRHMHQAHSLAQSHELSLIETHSFAMSAS